MPKYSADDRRRDREAARKLVPLALLAPGVDGPYQTVWRFLYDREPWVLCELEDPIHDLLPYERRAWEIASREQEPVVTIDAPPGLGKTHRVGCYTKAVLFETWPANP